MEEVNDLTITLETTETLRPSSISPNISPSLSPGGTSPSGSSPSLSRQRSASIPVTPESLMGVRERFLNAAIENKCNNFLGVESDNKSKLPRSAPELRVDEASSGSVTPWNDDPSEYSNSVACTVLRPQPDVLSRRASDSLAVSRQHRSRRRKSLSPHHGRTQSTRSASRPRGNSFPHIGAVYNRDRSPSIPRDWDDDWYTLRQFCTTSKGVIINKGDLYRHRCKSNNSVGSVASSLGASEATSYSSGQVSHEPPKRVLMLGTVGVGKTALVTQFMTSEYMNAYDASLDEEECEKTVSMILDGEEHDITFIDSPILPGMPSDDVMKSTDAFLVVYSITDRGTFQKATDALFHLKEKGCTDGKAVILVGNKADLVRTREVTEDEAKSVACTYECKFVETSAAIGHQVDELLVGIVTQIRLQAEQKQKESLLGHKKKKKSSTRRRASSFINKLLGRGSEKSQSCGNLQVL